MIARKDVIKAWKIVCQYAVLPQSDLDQQLVTSLLVYKRRCEVHSLDEAFACLKNAGYEIEGQK